MLEAFKNLDKKQKIWISIVVIIYLIILVISIKIIWFPKTDKLENEMTQYSFSGTFQQVSSNKYLTKVNSYITGNNTDELFNLLEDNYKTLNGITENTVYSFLESKLLIGEDARVTNYSVSNEGDTYIYKYNYEVKGIDRVLYLVEEKPYNYKLIFDNENVPIINTEEIERSVNGVLFKFLITGKTNNSIKYKVTITNTNDVNLKFNFSDINNVTLNTKNNGSIKLSSSILSSLDSNSIPKNSTIVKEFMFDIGFEQQGDISGFTFSNVMYGASNITLNVVF